MNNRHLYPKNWQELRTLIRIRDEFQCTICGKKETELRTKKGNPTSLHVMHLDGDTFNNDYTTDGNIFNNEYNNLACGCPECHRIYDQRNGNNNRYVVKENHQIIDLTFQTIKQK